jgi:hypothetical protein
MLLDFLCCGEFGKLRLSSLLMKPGKIFEKNIIMNVLRRNINGLHNFLIIFVTSSSKSSASTEA